MRSFIIHLPNDHKRASNAQRLVSLLPGAEIIDALVGRDVVGETATRPGNLFRPHYPFPLSPAEVGCFLSHRKSWKKIVDEGLEYALTVEDDMDFDPAIWPGVLDLIKAHANADSYIRIPAKHREKPIAAIDRRGDTKLFRPREIGLQMVAQVVGRDAAKRLLHASDILDRPVDTFMQMHWVTGQQALTILPGGVRELTNELGGSTIQKKTPAGGKLLREIRRASYRVQVALRPQKP